MAFVYSPFQVLRPRACAQPFFAPRKPPPSVPLNVADSRLAASRQETFRLHNRDDHDDERRRQLVSESLSPADLHGILNPDPVVVSPASAAAAAAAAAAVTAAKTAAAAAAAAKTAESRKRPRPANLAASRSPDSPPRPGDLVLHSRHGIGRFLGLERTVDTSSVSPVVQEYAVLAYRDGDVYVPLNQFEKIRRLHPVEITSVKRLDSMHAEGVFPSRATSRTRKARTVARQKTRQKIRKQLVNLHELYSARNTITRPLFPIDQPAEEHFAELCEFQLTEDQKTATHQILRDISESERPMDRLLCGDVGFGKTEVAIRATFRVLRAGKQVAVLAPTTILAQQHYITFKDRFESEYPEFTIACMTRFVSRKSITAAKAGIKDGSFRIAIGTHMLLSDSVSFADIGLLIVDEEHRFGVNQKEKIRARYEGIDILFLSATPIPRTLHLTLSGLRDASVLRSAPIGRKPITTRVAPQGTGPVRQAIANESRRGGQIFFVVPRIEGVLATADWIQELFPDLRVLIAHGQLTDLEERIWSFANRQYDVLVCTTIIENGINMPHVNTIIVQDSARFGLAQLHQLRGRVGRSEVQAYAWFLYNEGNSSKSMHAIQRLKTLEEFNDLGSGFAIAQKDMEMRGVGTVLGVEQHGNNSIDSNEYAEMLSEELEHARTGEPIPITMPATATCEVFLPVASFISDEYIPDFGDKMAAYTALSSAKSAKELVSIAKQMKLRHGQLPGEAIRYICVLELKLLAREVGIHSILSERQHVILEWGIDEAAFSRMLASVEDEKARSRLEHIVMQERVFVRGLGICSGDVQLAKLRAILKVMCKAAEKLPRRGSSAESAPGPKLINSLDNVMS